MKAVLDLKFWDDKSLPSSLLQEYKQYLDQINFIDLTNSLDEKFNRIERGIARITDIIKNLKSFSRVDQPNTALIDINQNIIELDVQVF